MVDLDAHAPDLAIPGPPGAIPTGRAPNADRPTGLLPVGRSDCPGGPAEGSRPSAAAYCTAFIMSKIGRYIATTMPPTITPRTTIITGSISESRAETATSTSSS